MFCKCIDVASVGVRLYQCIVILERRQTSLSLFLHLFPTHALRFAAPPGCTLQACGGTGDSLDQNTTLMFACLHCSMGTGHNESGRSLFLHVINSWFMQQCKFCRGSHWHACAQGCSRGFWAGFLGLLKGILSRFSLGCSRARGKLSRLVLKF